jgi:hypothetical protein
MINIVCLKWGSKYGPEYVNRLFYAVQRHVTKPFRFWCFTDDDTGIDYRIKLAPLRFADRLESWWNKIMLFSDETAVPLGEQIFYIDLDTLIVDNIDNLLTNEVPEIIVLRDFYHGIAKTAGSVASGLMSWKHGQYAHIWKNFIQDPESAVRLCRPHGDQRWIEHCLDSWYYWQDLFPMNIVSFKMHCQSGIPKDSKIICYHGRPSIPESVSYRGKIWKWDMQPQAWVLDHWKDQ